MEVNVTVAAFARELYRLEAAVVDGLGSDTAVMTDLLEQARAASDDVLIGRVLCLRSRSEIMNGDHATALVSASEAIASFDRFDTAEPAISRSVSGPRAEAYRAAGTAHIKLGRVAQALPLIEEAVRIAQAGLGATAPPPKYETIISAQAALIRSLVTLGVSLFAIREVDTAIDVYHRAMAVAAVYPSVYDNFLDDVMLARWNLTDALHERVRRRRSAGDLGGAREDIAAARALLDAEAWRIAPGKPPDEAAPAGGPGMLTAWGRAAYFSALGHHHLICARPAEALATFERQFVEIHRLSFVDYSSIADAQTGMAQALLELNSLTAALEHSALALDALDRHDESNMRAAVLLIRSIAFRRLGNFDAAYSALEAHHALRARLEAVAAQQYASHMTAQIGLERARADAESHRRVAATLETLGRIGQEITAKLDTGTIFRIVARYVESMLRATTFAVWLLDADGERLEPVFGFAPAAGGTDADARAFALRAIREQRELLRTEDGDGISALCAPLIVGDRVLGAVSIETARPEVFADRPEAFSEDERSMFVTLATYMAIAIDNASAYTKLEQTVVALRAAQSELAQQTAEFERLSMTDMLTGVANRRQLHDRGQVEIATMRRKGSALSVAMFDIDHFKRVNDTFGHAVGDTVLQQIARVAKDWLRPGDLIARVGGEEFALLLPGVSVREAVAIAERIRASIADLVIETHSSIVRVTSSFGVAAFETPADTLDHVLSRADGALYAAKQAGRDRVHAASMP